MYDLKEKILSTISIENYISRFVHLKKRGKHLVGLCPFHKEKTPSFTITPELGLYYCFGCGRGGNLFDFVIEREKVSFKEALEILASYAGIQTQNLNSNEPRYIHLLNFLNQIFREYLFSEDGKVYLEYILSRGVDLSYLTKFQIGACPDSFDWILQKFPKEEKETKINDLLELGIIKKNQQNQYYNFFRNRVLFPIFDLKNNTIAFGGRTIIDTENPKYLNSPESSFFQKGSTLYGLNFAIEAIKKQNKVFLTEGYLDVIGLHQIGIENVVAPLGTAFTEAHKKILFRYSKNIYLLLDGDYAGRRAILRILSFFQEESNSIRIIVLPEGLDPYDWSLQIKYGYESKEMFMNSIEYALTPFEFIFFDLFVSDEKKLSFLSEKNVLKLNINIKNFLNLESLKNYYLSLTIQEKQFLIEQVKNLLTNFQNEIFRELFFQEWKSITNLDLKSTFIKHTIQKKTYESTKNLEKEIDVNQQEILLKIERTLIAYLLKNPEMILSFLEELNHFTFYDEISLLVYRTLYEHFVIQNKMIHVGAFFSNFSTKVQQIFIPYLLEENNHTYELQEHKADLVDAKYKNIIKELIIKHRIEEVNSLIKAKEQELKFTQEAVRYSLLKEIEQLIKEKKELKRHFKEVFK